MHVHEDMAVSCNRVHILKINCDEGFYDDAEDAAKNGTPFVATKEEERVTHIYDRICLTVSVVFIVCFKQNTNLACVMNIWWMKC